MSSGDLDITEGNPSIKCSHDECRPQHVRIDGAETCLLTDGAHPAVSSPPIQSLPILSLQDRSLGSLADGQVDRPSSSGHQRYHRRLASLSHDPERSMPFVKGQIFNVGSTGFADPEPVEAE